MCARARNKIKRERERKRNDISSVLTLILARKLSFRRENICLTRRSKIQHDLRVGLKSQLLTILDWGFGLNCCKMDFSINVTFWFTVQTCCTYFYSFLALKFMILHLFQFFDLFYFTFFFLSLFWCVNRDWTKYGIATRAMHEYFAN